MTQYQEERKYLESFKTKVSHAEGISKNDLVEFMTNYEDLIEIASVSTRMIDRLMLNYDKLKNVQSFDKS